MAAFGSAILAAGCSSPAPLRSELPARSVAGATPAGLEGSGALVEAWPPAECLGRADCARVCIAGEVRRCNEAGRMWERGDEKHGADLPRAAELYQRACAAGLADGCRHVEAVIGELQDGCERAVADRCTDLGYVYEHGIGVLADLHHAAHLYRTSCDADAPVGCSRLGTLYDEGRGVDTDWAQAARLYAKACKGGFAAGCSDLGYLFEHGRGVGTADEKRARELYREGCERGSGTACMYAEILAEREKATQKAPVGVPPSVAPPLKPPPPTKRPPPPARRPPPSS
jgi:hypothetical protein